MWSSRLFLKLLLINVGITLALAVTFWITATSLQREETRQLVELRLRDTAVLARDDLRQSVADLLDRREGEPLRTGLTDELQAKTVVLSESIGARFTIFDSEGVVLADSERDAERMFNHANRPELIEASKSGIGVDRRVSQTLNVESFYLAMPMGIDADEDDANEDAYVRVARRFDELGARSGQLLRSLFPLLLLFVAITTAMTYWIAKQVVVPIEKLIQRVDAIGEGDDETPVAVYGFDEVGVLANRFNEMQTELMQRFRRLRDNNEQMSTVLGNMDEGIIAVDAKANVLLANKASRRIMEFSAGVDHERPLLEVVRNRPLHDVVSKCLETGRAVQAEFQSPSRRDVSVRATCLPGVPAPGIVVVIHDITELRRLENLRQEFVANVSHELKTPLASIKAYAETLRLGAIDDPEHNLRFVGRIEEQADRLHQLILDMLHIARVESGEEAFEITRVAVEELVDTCIAQYLTSAERKSISLVVDRPETPLTVQADKDGLRTVMDNLISNAIKYTPEGGSVTVSWREDATLSAEDQAVIIEVQDTGIGIEEQDQARVFERFYRVDRARSREIGGTGLGLSIVKHLSQAFGGNIELESSPGEGSTFRVKLPVSPRPETPE